MSGFSDRRRTMLSFKKHREHNRDVQERSAAFLEDLFDPDTFHALFPAIESDDPIHFPGYRRKLKELRRVTGMSDAVQAGYGKIGGMTVCAAALNRAFLMGSMGTVVGETVTRITELAAEKHVPLILFSASGGARMQEGMFSLMQMAKTSAAIERFRRDGGLYISVLLHPTTGGVSASFAMLGDIILAEPGALIGFAGPRVIEQTIGEQLPPGFQRAEFQLEHGFVDRIVPREEMRPVLQQILRLHC
ncbi:MAG: acetyl-CoA carboxylase carboxyl transferase subunit beta [Eubacterium sp.]|nr:acetyl-CoA carboxylase carboxyl transferase subunit beta [Eubacterium sp.]